MGCRVDVISDEDLVSPLVDLKLSVAITDSDSGFEVLLGVGVVGEGVVGYCIGFLTREPATLSLPFFFAVGIRRNRVFEVRLGHGAHIGVLEAGVEAVDRLDVAFGAEVNVGETALVGALFANVHNKLVTSLIIIIGLVKHFTQNILRAFCAKNVVSKSVSLDKPASICLDKSY